MPCNCGNSPAAQIRKLNQKLARENELKAKKLLMNKKIYEAQKKHLLREQEIKNKSSNVENPKILNSINISNQYLTINYSDEPVTPPVINKIGLLSKTALTEAGGESNLSDNYRSVGYFGIGFGGIQQKVVI